MAFVNSVKLFFSNWGKVVKLFLYFVFAVLICGAMLIPCYYAFKNIIVDIFTAQGVWFSLSVAVKGIGLNIHNIFVALFESVKACFNANIGLSIYMLFVIFFVFPFLLNSGKFVVCEMLYGYMSSKSKIGFLHALIKTLNRVFAYSFLKTLYCFIFIGAIVVSSFAVGLIDNAYFITHWLLVCELFISVIIFTIKQITVTAWAPSVIVFGISAIRAFGRGIKVIGRKWKKNLFITFLILLVGIGLAYLFCPLFILTPIVSGLLCMLDMSSFFTNQGMRYYVNNDIILTPKRLEEVDSINKAKYIL